jgi:DNA-binding transcriptional LysR family regulator
MRREDMGDLAAFVVVADENSFTRAAAKLGTSQSALSHAIRRLEQRLGMRLLTRTTRSVAPTEAGEQLIETVRPAIEEIDAKIASLSAMRETVGGTLRITASEHASRTILWPKIKPLLFQYPELVVELNTHGGLMDIVSERYDAGVRLGERVAKDMFAVRIGPRYSMAITASPEYWRKNGVPKTPQDLAHHRCINIRFPGSGALFAWDLESKGRELNVRVEGPLILDDMPTIIDAAVSGLGVAYTIEEQVRPQLESGQLMRVMQDWCEPFDGYHLYYPNKRQPSPAMALLIETLRYRY